MVVRQVKQRFSFTGRTGGDEYLRYLEEHPGELDKLIDFLTTNVSRFFMDTLIFESFADRILPAIVLEKKETHEP